MAKHKGGTLNRHKKLIKSPVPNPITSRVMSDAEFAQLHRHSPYFPYIGPGLPFENVLYKKMEEICPSYTGGLWSYCNHMQQHFSEPLRVQTLSNIAGVSIAQLERLFKRVFQLTPQQLLTKLRIETAMRMLHTDMRIAEIGQICGFSDQSAFSRKFKSTVGVSPRDYRAMVLGS